MDFLLGLLVIASLKSIVPDSEIKKRSFSRGICSRAKKKMHFLRPTA